MKRFTYYAPETLAEAVATFRDQGEGGRPLAGGTDLVVQMKEGGMKFPYPSYIVSLRKLKELRGIRFSEGEGLRIGAGITFAELESEPTVRERFPILVDGASIVGSIQTRNMATAGGNLCNAAPSAEMAPPLIALGAQAHIIGPQGERTLPLEEFFLGPGSTVLGNGDILVDVLVPTPPGRTGGMYQRHTPRKEMDIAVVGVGVVVTLAADGETIQRARVVLGAVAPTPMRATDAEVILEGQRASNDLIARAAQRASEEARPISDVRGTAAFRRELVRVLTVRCTEGAIAKARAAL
ncbi:MAG: FAD binding domain-containing protein [Dehalococcoidia bacterium]